MTWRIHDLIHLYFTDIRLSELETTRNPLGLCNDLLDENKRELLLSLNLLTQEAFDVFNDVVRKNNNRVTTLDQVLAFVNICAEDPSTYPFSILAGDFSKETLLELTFPEDLLVIIEVED